jgi:ribosome-associated protein
MTNPDPMLYLNSIAQAIFDKKGFNILALDVRAISTLTDYVIIAEGNIEKHVSAIARAITEQLEQLGLNPVYTEGVKEGDWVVIDYLHIMVHLFTPGLRDRYQLEQLWKEGQIVDLHINVEPKNNSTSVNSFRN